MDVTQLVSKDQNKDVILYYKMDYLRLLAFLEDMKTDEKIRMDEEICQKILSKLKPLDKLNPWNLFDKLGKRVNPREGEPTSFLPFKSEDISICNALVPWVENVLQECIQENKFENSKQWWERWVAFRGDPYVFKGLPAALYAKEMAPRMTNSNFITVYVIHALPRIFGFHYDTWEREEIDILWLCNSFIERYERINDQRITTQSWKDFNMYQQLQYFMSSTKYSSQIFFINKRNARHLMRVCLNMDGYNFGFKDIANYSDLYSNKMSHNIILLSQILHEKVLLISFFGF